MSTTLKGKRTTDASSDFSTALLVADDVRNRPSKSPFTDLLTSTSTLHFGLFGSGTLKEENGTSSIQGGETIEAPSSEELSPEDKFAAQALGFSKMQDRVTAQFLRRADRIPTRREPMAERILRVDVAARVIPALKKLSESVHEPQGAIIVRRIFDAIQHATRVSPNSPFSRLLLALYDGLAFDNQWIQYSREQHLAAAAVLTEAVRRPFINDKQVDRAIAKLELIGFNTIPFAFSLPEEPLA